MQVNELIFPVDFFMLEMKHDHMASEIPLILDRQFLRTSCTKNDIHKGTFTMKSEGEIIKVRLLDSIRYPRDFESCFSIDAFDSLVQDYLNTSMGDDNLEIALV